MVLSAYLRLVYNFDHLTMTYIIDSKTQIDIFVIDI